MLRFIGIKPLLGKVLPLLFGEAFRADPARKAEFASWRTSIGKLNRKSIRLFGKAIFSRDDVLADLRALADPAQTLVIVGEVDIPTPPSYAQDMHDAIKGSSLMIIPQAGHSSPVERPHDVSRAISAFLGSVH